MKKMTLLPNEKILYQGKITNCIYLCPLFFLIVGIALAIIAFFIVVDFLYFVALFVALLAALSFFSRKIIKHTSKFIITDHRLILSQGLLHKSHFELMLDKCEGVSCDQSIFGRIFDYAYVRATTGGAWSSFDYLKDPDSFRNALIEATENYKKNFKQ